MPTDPRAPNGAAAPRGAPTAFLWATMGLLALCLVLGGGSRLNAFQLTVLELLCLPLAAWSVWRLTMDRLWTLMTWPALILAGLLAIPLIQLLPLPPDLWRGLPGHQAPAEALELAGLELGWRPLSLTPDLTVRYLLALLMPVTLFLAACLIAPRKLVYLAGVVVVMALLSIGLGLMQTVGGDDSPLYLYAFANRDSPVGLFANRNHQAALLVVSLPLAAAGASFARARGVPPLLLWSILAGLFLVIIPCVIILKSRAGVALLVPALLVSLGILWRGGGPVSGRRWLGVLAAAIGIGLVVGGSVAFGPLMERFASTQEGRLLSGPITARAAWELMPLGSGLGSFKDIYSGVEPIESMATSHWLHAHNDVLELWLEAGLPALILMLVFLAWWGRATILAWRRPPADQGAISVAAAAVIGLLLLHSLVDYPLRTPAMAAVFAVACGILVRTGGRPASGMKVGR
jgi:O-antigen ligase